MVLTRFREEPNLLSEVLKNTNKEEKLRNSNSTEAPSRTRLNSAYKTRKLSQEFQHESRPLSANVNKIIRSCRPMTAKVKEID